MSHPSSLSKAGINAYYAKLLAVRKTIFQSFSEKEISMYRQKTKALASNIRGAENILYPVLFSKSQQDKIQEVTGFFLEAHAALKDADEHKRDRNDR